VYPWFITKPLPGSPDFVVSLGVVLSLRMPRMLVSASVWQLEYDAVITLAQIDRPEDLEIG
jgi:hypothetical protein